MTDSCTEKDSLNRALKERLLALMPEPALNRQTEVPSFHLIHKRPGKKTEHCVSSPFCCYIIEGSKQTVLGNTKFEYHAGQSLVSGVDMPSASCVLNPDDKNDFLAVYFCLDSEMLLDLVLNMKPGEVQQSASPSPIFVFDAEEEFVRALLRLMELQDKPSQIPVMAPMLLRELHYLLLLTPQGGSLCGLARTGSPNRQIVKAIAIMKANIASSVPIDKLAYQVNMSVSSLHRHFKNVTGISPLQYHKRLRLYEAQRLMLVEREGVARAALTVGYESPNQFSREYKRLFGESPQRDIQNKLSQHPL